MHLKVNARAEERGGLTFSGSELRRSDPDRFLLSLFAPRTARPGLWALFAFNAEIARTREVVSETALGLIRLQWWRERITGIYEGSPEARSGVMADLSDAVSRHDLPRDALEAMIYAREFDLEGVPPASLEGLVHYAAFTSEPLHRLAVRMTGENPETGALRGLAVFYALVGLMRAVPLHARQQRCFLPADLLAQEGVYESALYGGRADPQAVARIVRAVLEEAASHEREARDLPKGGFPGAALCLAGMHRGRIMRRNGDVLTWPADPLPFRELRLFLSAVWS